ncbi:HD domain-containing protein [Kitasatospora sp. GP82]|uniref:RelA/SpoT family protein n=1 Tax=Kitasatospora sp. GP82 TaxID=3035089 RepID=UPI0024748685|nr:HD domain-containing protein [Kitasatospora sp. GP82]MDH6127718.1 guanosine-3',5'-bis(diphosphate) 3'-pyrophosphohydrolase [Kitasatospora sp. GP82]
MTIDADRPLAGQPAVGLPSISQPSIGHHGEAKAPPGRLNRAAFGRAALGRAGRAALLATGRTPVPDAIEPIVEAHRRHHPQADLTLLGRAYRTAETSHRGQLRKSGEPFITHPLAVTMILAQLGAGTTTLVASLLHDTVEDTEMTLAQVGAEFGPEVAYLVDGVTKLEKVDFGAAAEAETFRKMLVATGADVRVMVIKLADRLHNMRTIRHMKPASRIRIAKVTRDVLIPLAERLGIQVLKAELEDIVFATLHPEEHARTRALVAAHEAEPDGLLQPFAEALTRQLAESGVAASVTVRARHCVSVHRILLKRSAAAGPDGLPQALQPADFGRLLVTVEENADCYAVLGELHTCWTPLPGEFKDFIATPKFNLYQSLHTAVALDGGAVVEVLVRSRQMHRVAEFGVVALGDPHHPGGQQQPGEQAGQQPVGRPGEPERTEGGDPARPGWLSRLLEWQQETPDPDIFWSALTADLSDDREITAVTEDGERLQLPAGASCVDAAYLLGEETGHRCLGARVNGRLVALSTVLGDGDVVGVLTEQAGPSGPAPEWLEYARTPAARLAIERWLAEHPAGAPSTAPAGPQAGPGGRPSSDVPAAPNADPGAARGETPPVAVPGSPGAPVRLARCCTPVPPDAVVGYGIRGGAFAVHRVSCPAGERLLEAGRTPVEPVWVAGACPPFGFRVTLEALALNRPRLLADLTAVMSAEGIGIVAAAVEPPQDLRVRHSYTVELPTAEMLPAVMRAMLRVSGVYDVYRAGLRHRNGDDPPSAGMRPSRGIHGRSAAFTDT